MSGISKDTNGDSQRERKSWIKRLHDFVDECAASAPIEEADRVREAVILLQGSGQDAAGRLDALAIEAMLRAGAAESAVLAILGRDSRFMLSRGDGHGCLATVIARGGSEEAIAEGTSLALALLAAHVSAVLVGLERDAGTVNVRQTAASALLH